MVEVKEEQKYKRLRKLAQELHLPIPETFIELEVRDKDGKVVQHHRQRSHSWVRNAYNLLLAQMASVNLDDAAEYGAGKLSIKVTDTTIKAGAGGAMVSDTVAHESDGAAYRGANADITSGIQVGSGTDAESFEDYVLQTQIVEGAAGGELNHIAMDVPTKSYAALTWTITWFRYFNNNSGGDVNINEVALCTEGEAIGTSVNWIMSRDKLASTVTVPDTGQLKVTYTIQLTYPA